MKRGIIIILAALLLAGCATGEWGGIKDKPRGGGMGLRYLGIFAETPQIGMTEEYFKKICPILYKVNITTTSYGIHKQYVFSDGVHPKYVYFENGVLTAMQD